MLNHKAAIQKIETNVALLLQKFNELEFPQRTGTQAIAPIMPVSPQAPTAQPIKTRIKPGLPPAYDGDRVTGRAFLTSILLYISLTGDDLQDEQAQIHWALSYFKSGRAAMLAECVTCKEMESGVLVYANWEEFQAVFIATFCPENESTTAIMRLKSAAYYQNRRTVNAYIDEFEDLISLSKYSDLITTVIKFHRGLNPMTQEIESTRLNSSHRIASRMPSSA